MEKIFANETADKGLISKIYKQLMELNIKKQTTQSRNGQFSKEDIEMGDKHMKRCSTLPIVIEMQIKTTMRYHLTQGRMTIIKKSTNNKCWRSCGEKRTLLQGW